LFEFAKALEKSAASDLVLVSHNSDHSVDSRMEFIANSEKISHWYAQNNETNHPKITSIPIGLENQSWQKNGLVSDFEKARSLKCTKLPRILVSVSLRTNPKARAEALLAASSCKVAYHYSGTFREYVNELNKSMFVLSPPGNGIDCHRTYEGIYLRTIPIVIKPYHGMNNDDFPGLLLNNWHELINYDEAKLENLYAKCAKKLDTAAAIWAPYWGHLIKKRSEKQSFRNHQAS
jgi:hypothetical protein